MSYSFELSEDLQKTLEHLGKKDKALAAAVGKKIKQIINLDPQGVGHYKNLRGDMSHLKRAHVGSFVLTFKVRGDTIFFEKLAHHDKAYN